VCCLLAATVSHFCGCHYLCVTNTFCLLYLYSSVLHENSLSPCSLTFSSAKRLPSCLWEFIFQEPGERRKEKTSPYGCNSLLSSYNRKDRGTSG